jgi:hypothetical protein
VARVGCERFRNFENVFERAAEIVDDDNRAVTFADMPKLRLHDSS